MIEIIPLALIIGPLIHLFLFGVFSLRFNRWCESVEENLIYGIPFLFLLISFLGSLYTVGFEGIISILGLPVLLLIAIAGKVSIHRPVKTMKWHAGAAILWPLFLLLRFYTLFDFKTGDFFAAYYDDYSYILQINLLEKTRTESGFWELIRIPFGLDFKYSIYHYIEFYFILFFKTLLPGTSFVWFNFYLKIFLQTVAVISTSAYFYKNSARKPGFWLVLSAVLLFYTSLRFNLVDDFFFKIYPTSFSKAVFFQNYYFAAPLSYHVSYKVALGFIFLIPLFLVFQRTEIRIPELFAFGISAVLASIISLPFVATLIVIRIGINTSSKKTVLLILWLFIIMLTTALFYFTDSSRTGLLRYAYSLFFHHFNLIFENYYWQIFYLGSMIILFARIKSFFKIGLAFVLLFPLVYLSPNLLFKIYALYAVLFFIYLLNSSPKFRENQFITIYFPALLFVNSAISFIPLTDVGQAFTNYHFPVICLAILSIFFQFEYKSSSFVFILVLLFFLVFNSPAIIYDNKTPLHREIIPARFLREECLKEEMVNILSISTYTSVPFCHNRFLLGHGLMNKLDNVFISSGGFETIADSSLRAFVQSGLSIVMLRNPVYEETIAKRKGIERFLIEKNIKVVLIEKESKLDFYVNIIKPLSKKCYQEEEKGYQIFVLE